MYTIRPIDDVKKYAKKWGIVVNLSCFEGKFQWRLLWRVWKCYKPQKSTKMLQEIDIDLYLQNFRSWSIFYMFTYSDHDHTKDHLLWWWSWSSIIKITDLTQLWSAVGCRLFDWMRPVERELWWKRKRRTRYEHSRPIHISLMASCPVAILMIKSNNSQDSTREPEIFNPKLPRCGRYQLKTYTPSGDKGWEGDKLTNSMMRENSFWRGEFHDDAW